MAETPLLDQLGALGPVGERLLAACEAVVQQADRELSLLEAEAVTRHLRSIQGGPRENHSEPAA